MPRREDEYYREKYYSGHPPACTCVKCTRQRLSGLRHERKSDRAWLYILISVCIISTGFIAAGLIGQSIEMPAGIVVAAGILGILVWALASLKQPWSSFRSGLLSLIVALVALLVILAG